jgi:hypothetical protein
VEAGDESSGRSGAWDIGYVSVENLVVEIGTMFGRECALHF